MKKEPLKKETAALVKEGTTVYKSPQTIQKAAKKSSMRKKVLFSTMAFFLVACLTGATVLGLGAARDTGPSSSLPAVISQSATPIASSSSQPIVIVPVTLHAASVDGDLEVQVQDEAGQPIAGVPFALTITDSNGKSAEYTTEKLDGILYLESVDPSTYTIAIAAAEGFSMPEPVTCEVTAKVEYKEIKDINKKIVDAKKVNAAEDDASYGSATPAPATPSNTVEYVDSSKTDVKTVEKKEVIKYKPNLASDGTIALASGGSSGLYPVNDANGYLQSAYKLEVVATAQAAGVGLSMGLNKGILLLTDPTPESSGSESGSSSTTDPSTPSQPSEPSTPSDSSSSSSASSTPPETQKVPVSVLDANGKPIASFNLSLSEVKTTEDVTVTKVKYTGWQTIDGKVYFYDKNGNYVTGQQVIQGVNYFFSSSGVRGGTVGIDVSSWQGNIDWKAVKASGIEFAFIRVGYRGYSTGKLVEDAYFRKNIQGANAAGVKVGLYFFSQAITAEEAVEEASMVISLARSYGVSYPIAFDTEYQAGGRANGLSATQRTNVAIAFCETIRNAGYTPCVYASKSWFNNQLIYSSISKYRIWVAHYTTNGVQTNFASRYDLWQYTSTGSVAGIGTNVDMNISYI